MSKQIVIRVPGAVDRATVIGARLTVIVTGVVLTAAGLVGTVRWMRELVTTAPPPDTRWGMLLWQAVGGVTFITLLAIAAIGGAFIVWLSNKEW